MTKNIFFSLSPITHTHTHSSSQPLLPANHLSVLFAVSSVFFISSPQSAPTVSLWSADVSQLLSQLLISVHVCVYLCVYLCVSVHV